MIQYPSLNYLADSRGGDNAFATGFDLIQGIKDERAGKKAFEQYLASLSGGQQQPMSLASLAAPSQGQVTRAPLPDVTDPASQRVAQAHAASGGMPPKGAIESYIRYAAQKRGIDPDTAVRVAMSEGGVSDPTRQSDVIKDGVREQSYGPFQLYMGGGLGNEFQQATGLHPSDPSAWQKGIDFALDKAKEGGWGPWYGAAKAGIGDRDGIGTAQGAVEALAGGSGPQMAQSAPAGNSGAFMPPPDVMKALFSSRQTRPLAIELAKNAQAARQGNPEAALKLRKLQAEVNNLENPQEKPTDDMREYAAAKAQGFQGSLQDWIVGNRKAGATNITNTVGGEGLTPGWKKIDEGFADTYLGWNSGGFADSRKQIEQLGEAVKILESGENVTGKIGLLPDQLRPFFNEQGTIARENVEEVVQRSLREILGAQFTEKEGERLIARAFNPLLPPKENAKRVRRLLNTVGSMADAKQDMVDYFDQNGTLRGYKGSRPTASQISSLADAFGPTSEESGLPEGVSEEDIIETMKANNMTREQVMQRLMGGQ